MSVVEAIILGIVQGVTEFIPVSSSGHLVLVSKILGIENQGITFEILVHVATLLAVIIVLWKEVIELIRHPLSKTVRLLVIATIMTGAMYLIFNKMVLSMFETGRYIGFALIFTAFVLYFSEYASKQIVQKDKLEKTSYLDSIIIGIAQGIALIPGVSRSGTTISAALNRKLERKTAIKFSFLLSIPAIAAAFITDIFGVIRNGDSLEMELIPYAAGFIAAFISGYFSVRFLIKFVTKKGVKPFAIYVIILAVFVIADQFIFNIVL